MTSDQELKVGDLITVPDSFGDGVLLKVTKTSVDANGHSKYYIDHILGKTPDWMREAERDNYFAYNSWIWNRAVWVGTNRIEIGDEPYEI